MKKRGVWLGAMSGLLLCASVAGAAENQMDPPGFRLPEGNAERGRSAFVSLRCASCHRVAGDPHLERPTAETQAPALRFDADDEAAIAQSIIAPSHTIAFGFGQGDPEEPQKSSMLNLTDEMTVRQLADIVAYLKGTES